jgi:acyl-CoA synthetase (NDP forming)
MSGLERLLRPKSIVAIGGLQASRVVEQCQLMAYQGEIWPVHPEKTEVRGIPAFKCVEDLPGVPDAAFIGVNRHATVDMVRALRESGCGGAVCYASGFREADETGGELQAALIAAAGEMPILGPNCYGFYGPTSRAASDSKLTAPGLRSSPSLRTSRLTSRCKSVACQ